MLSAKEIIDFLKENKTFLKEHFHCSEIGLFGSFARNEQTDKSDIDLLVVFEPNTPDLYEVEESLKQYFKIHFNREVDICAKKWINPIFRPLVLKEAVYAWQRLLYPAFNSLNDKILLYTKNYKTAEELYENGRDFDAAMMNFIVIGENVGKLSGQIIEKNQHINWNKIYGLRNIIAHHYFGINVDIVWQIICKDLPELNENLKQILTNNQL